MDVLQVIRNKYSQTDGSTVQVSWNKINPQSIKRDSIWRNINEKNCQNKAFFTSIKENFATKTVPGLY